jgi:hypothetical protein
VNVDRCEAVTLPPFNAKGYSLKIKANDLDSKGLLGIGKSSPYFIIKGIPHITEASVYPTPTVSFCFFALLIYY